MRDLGEQRLAIQIMASGCVRTRRDAVHMIERMHRHGWHESLKPLYHALLALIGDRSAGHGLNQKEMALFSSALNRMKLWWIGDSDCRCLRGPSGQIVTRLSSCPVHSEPTADKVWVAGLGFLG